MILKKTIVVAIFLAGTCWLGCNTPSSRVRLNTLNLGHLGEVETLDPALVQNHDTIPLVLARFETLYEYNFSDPSKLIPSLASEMPTFSSDRMTLTIPIRSDIRFRGLHRGLTVDDIIFSLKRLSDPRVQSPGWWLFEGQVIGLDAFRLKLAHASPSERIQLYKQPIEGLEKLGPYLVRIHLSRPYPQVLYALTSVYSAPVPQEAIDRGMLIGETGPFKLLEWDRGHKLVLERNSEFHADFLPTVLPAKDSIKPLPFLERVEAHILRDGADGWKRFWAQELDLLEGNIHYSPKQIDELLLKSISVKMNEQGPSFSILLNLRTPVLQSRSLRQALSTSIDRKRWIEISNPGYGTKQASLLPPEVGTHPAPARVPFDFDLKRAHALIQQSGVLTKALGNPLRLIFGDSEEVTQRLGSFLKMSFATIGVPVNVGYFGFNEYLERLRSGDFDLALFGWSPDYPDSRSILRMFFGPNRPPNGPNFSFFQSPAFDRIYEEAINIPDETQRSGLVRRLEEILYEDCPFLFGYHQTTLQLSQPWVKNFKRNEFLLNNLKYIRIDQIPRP